MKSVFEGDELWLKKVNRNGNILFLRAPNANLEIILLKKIR